MNLGPAEILVILVIALIVFGPKKLPEVGRQVGAAVRELRKMQDSVKSELDSVMRPVLDDKASPSADTVQGLPPLQEPDHTSLPAAPAPPSEPRDPGFEGPSESFS
jgi:sec-independent protein translocase protein TatA